MEWDEGNLMALVEALQPQVNNTVEGANPVARICSGDNPKTTNEETAGVVSGGVGRIRKGLLPQFKVRFFGAEFDISKQVFSGPRNP